MPFLETKDARLYYEFDSGSSLPVLVFANSLGTNLHMWDEQQTFFQDQFRILRFDFRGHGKSSVPNNAYRLGDAALDVLRLLDHLGLATASFCGLSFGGMVGQWLAIHTPERFSRFCLCNTAAKIGTPEMWNQRIATVMAQGMESIIPAVLDRWYTQRFGAKRSVAVETTSNMLSHTNPQGYALACAAIRDMDQRADVGSIRTPTLVVYGDQDAVTSPADARFLLNEIAGSEALCLSAAHLSNIEAAEAFNIGVLRFLKQAQGSATMDESSRYEQGMRTRREVLGSEHVDAAEKNRTAFNETFQDFITRYAWGEVWSDEGLPRHTRSLVALALMVALNREEEFKMHVRAALNNGVTPEEISKLLMHTAIYCGLPAANNAYAWAASVLASKGL